MLLAADAMTSGGFTIDSFWSALAVALVASAVSVVLDVVFGTNDDDTYAYRVIQRIARRVRASRRSRTHPGSCSSRSTAWPCRCCIRRCATAARRRWRAGWSTTSHRLVEWETDLSSQTGASQAGILLGSNDDIPAFRWVEKETATLLACSGAGGLRGDRAAASTGQRAADRRRREPRQPAVGRGRPHDPHRQPHGRREAGQPRLPGVLRQRLQRDARARPVRLGGDPRGDRRRRGRSGATSGPAVTAAASIRSCAPRCA